MGALVWQAAEKAPRANITRSCNLGRLQRAEEQMGLQELYAVLAQPRIDLDCPRALRGSLSEAIEWSLATPGALLHRTIQVRLVSSTWGGQAEPSWKAMPLAGCV